MRFLILISFFSLNIPLVCFAETFFFEKEKNQNTLLSNSITTITQDNLGFMWFGTEYGLVRFDGYNYLGFYANEDNKESLPSNIIKRIIKRNNGDIWIGTDRGIAYFDMQKNKIIRPEYASKLNKLQINTISEDFEDNLWIGTNQGVFLLNASQQKIIKVIIALNNDEDFNVNFIENDVHGNIWIGSNFGFCYIEKPVNGSSFFATKFKGKLIKNKNRLGFFKIDQQNNLWINSNNFNYYYDIDASKTLAVYKKTDITIDGKSILPISDDLILIGSRWNGIIELEKQKDGILTKKSQIWFENNMTSPGNTINVLYKDNNNNIWAGTKAGIYVHKQPVQSAFHIVKAAENNPNKLSHNAISSILETSNGDIWIGTSNGLNKLQLIHGSINEKSIFKRYISNQFNSESSTADAAIQCIVEDNNHHLWLGTKQGIIYFDPVNENFYTTEKTERFLENYNLSLIKTMYKDRHDNIWIGFTVGGLVLYSAEKKVFFQIDRFSKSDVWAIDKDFAGNMWIGTRDGLFRFNSEILISQIEGNTKTYRQDPDNERTIPANWVTSIHIDRSGEIWVGTSEGLCKYNAITDNFERINLAVGNHPPYISGIQEDNKNRVWVSTTSGVFRITKKGNIDFFEISKGEFSSINYTFGHYLTSQGEILLGGISGLIHFKPDEIVPDSTKQKILFCQLFSPSRNSPYQTILLNGLEKVSLTHEEKQFSISFSTLNYASLKSIKYSYRIKEFGDNWIYLDDINRISFSNLPTGKYTLQVRSTTVSGFWQDEYEELRIVLLPPWWKTKFAYFIYFLFFSGSLYLIFNWLKERERLIQMNELNHFKLVFYTNLLHSFKTPLTLMQAPLNNLIRNHKKMSPVEMEEMLSYLQRNTKRLTHTVLQLLEFRKIDRGKLSLNLTSNDIVKLLHDVYDTFLTLSESKQIKFYLDCDTTELKIIFDFEKIETVLFNLLSNAFKFTEKGGEITITAKINPEKNKFLISISDTGIGIAPEYQTKIFERFWQVYNDNPLLIQGAGIGLSIAKDFIEAHKEKIRVTSLLGKGSCFSFSIPLNESQYNYIPVNIQEHKSRKAEYVSNFVEIENEISIHEIGESEEIKKLPPIFVISKNKEMLNFLYTTFSKEYHITLFEYVNDIFKELSEQTPVLIMIDVNLSDKSTALNCCKKVKSDIQTKHIPLVILSETTDDEDELKVYNSGADAFIPKPLDINLLFARINTLLKIRENVIDKTQRELISNPQNVYEPSQNTKFLRDAMQIIEENIDDEHFTLDDFARNMKVSRSILNSRMLTITKQTPIEYVRNVRLKRAAQLLRLNAYSVAEVSYKVGISDPRYFSTIFKKRYGMSPLQFAKQKHTFLED